MNTSTSVALNVILFQISTIILMYYITGKLIEGCNRF